MKQKGEDYLTTLDILLDFTANNVIGEVYLAEDFNARTKNLNHVPVVEDFDGYKEKPDSGPSDFRRKSRDSVLNSRDLLASTNLSVLNGNTIGEIFSEYTCINYNGKSVVDYVGVSENLSDSVVSFKVGDLTSYSDYKPCFCTLNINHEITSSEDLISNLEDAPSKYKWNAKDTKIMERSYLNAQRSSSILCKLTEIKNTHCSTAGDVTNINTKIVSTLKKVADSVCPRKGNLRMKTKKLWVDSFCINAKKGN